MDIETESADTPLSRGSGGSDDYNKNENNQRGSSSSCLNRPEARLTIKPSLPPRPPKEELNINTTQRRKGLSCYFIIWQLESPKTNFQSLQIEPLGTPPPSTLSTSLNNQGNNTLRR